MSTNDPNQQRPSLRMEELAITNFRTFRERTVIPFKSPGGEADAIAVFHGDNGSGKSNALAALDLFFQTALASLQEPSDGGDVLVPWDQTWSLRNAERSLVLAYRDRPNASDGPTVIEVQFSDPRLGRLRSVCTPSGNRVRVQLVRLLNDEVTPIPRNTRDPLATWLSAPSGPRSRPIAIVDTRRWHTAYATSSGTSLMPRDLATFLFQLRTSRNAQDRDIWRLFIRLLDRFGAFRGKDVSIEPAPGGSGYEIVVEDRGRTVLGLGELSSGEQQVIVLCAASLLAGSGILAIQEPELSLDATNQTLLKNILEDLSSKGIVDQIILESHVPFFDGPDVIRFHRDDTGATRVSRQPSQKEAVREIERKAKEQGAEHLWVTREGYTQLPKKMVEELSLQEGGHVWFLKGKNHWEAWPEAEVDDFLQGGEPDDA